MVKTKTMSLNVLFYIRRYKLTRKQECPIFLRITVNGKRAEIALKRTVKPDSWDNRRQAVKGKSLEANSINEQIRVFERRIYDEYSKLVARGEFISVDKLKNAFFGFDKKQVSIAYAFEFHNTRLKAQIGTQYAKGTYDRYEICFKLFKEFIRFRYDKADIPLLEIDYALINEFDYFLRTKRNCCNNTTVKYLKNLKKIINLARDMGWISSDPFINYKAKLEEVDKEILTQQELDILLNKEFEIARVEQIKDIFLFCCFTGLSYSDVRKLSKENIILGMDRHKWLQIARTKTNVLTKVPLLPIAQEILAKYENNPKCSGENRLLPVPSNQKYNAYLKELADCTGIKKNLTSHTARHTFATTVTLNNRIPMESVSKMLGHRSIKTTQHYSRVMEVKLSDDMAPLMKKYDSHNLKIVNE